MESLIATLAEAIRQVDGVKAVVLGGSRARGTHGPTSDVDLGIYYLPRQPLDLEALQAVATRFDDQRRAGTLTPIGGWGPWINGGGWLKVNGLPVDFLYRDLEKAGWVVEECLAGRVELHYQPGHPLGFLSSMYMGELAVCRVLWEAGTGELTALKARTSPFPTRLRQALIDKFAWEIPFSLQTAAKAVERGDVVYAAGCCFRAAACMLQTLFALNGQYWLNEKGAVAQAEGFPVRPENLKARIEQAFSLLAADGARLREALDHLGSLSDETLRLRE
jgi:hypothetical protein